MSSLADVEAGLRRLTETDRLNGSGTNGHRNGTNGNGNGYGTNGSHPRSNSLKRKTSTFMKKAYHKVTTVLLSNYVNYLLVFVPVGMASGFFGWNATANFTLNFLAIIPLAAMLSFATEQLSKSVGPTLGGLLNATFGNAVELIVRVPGGTIAQRTILPALVELADTVSSSTKVSIVALNKGEIRIVQASMLGSILSNILLVCSSSIFFTFTGAHSIDTQTFRY